MNNPPCAVPNCPNPPGRGRPVCSPHWANVPHFLASAYFRNTRDPQGFTFQWIRAECLAYARGERDT